MKLGKGTLSVKDADGNWKEVGECTSFHVNEVMTDGQGEENTREETVTGTLTITDYFNNDQTRVINGVEGDFETGLVNTKNITRWNLDNPIEACTEESSAASTFALAPPVDFVERVKRRNDGDMAQESRARFRNNLLDSVSQKALRYIRG